MSQKKIYHLDTSKWEIERLVFLLAGIFIVIFSLLGFFVHPHYHYGALFVGGMLIFFSLTGYCPLAILLAKKINKF
ncbi:MAG: DUF2892 domain-containing protein [Candidatus Moraniibacteriota bacterium]|nr:MAG: DUF2892 domain-containing protein [Candidatus Moranbacteria bacterium]